MQPRRFPTSDILRHVDAGTAGPTISLSMVVAARRRTLLQPRKGLTQNRPL